MGPDYSVKFNNGKMCPILGLGTWKADPGEVSQSVKEAIDIGYRHFDCAFIYENEAEVGKGIQEKVAEGAVQRSDLFVTSKLWNTKHERSKVLPAIQTSLENLGLSYLDLYLIHWPFAFKDIPGNVWARDATGNFITSDEDFLETWKGMEECVDNGLAKSIGLSNFNSAQIEAVLEIADVKPVNNQVECHPYFNQHKLIEFCSSKDITVTAYRPLGGAVGDNGLLTDPVLTAIGEKYKKSVAQIAVKYQMQRNVIVIPKSIRKQRLQENFDVFDFQLTDDEMSSINALNKDHRLVTFAELSYHKDYPFSLDF